MKYYLLLVLLLTSLLSLGQKFNVPASPYPITIEQPDGTKLLLYARGDESSHYPVTDDGYSIVKNANGIYEYAGSVIGGELRGTGIPARDEKERSFYENIFVSGLTKNLKPNKEIKLPDLKSASISNVYPSDGTTKTLLLLIKYPNLDSRTTVSQFNNLMNQTNYNGTGSFRDFYLVNSNNGLSINVDVFGWYTAAHEYLYYADTEGDERAKALVREAVNAAEAAGVNFSQYDNDHDGYVDNVMVVHSGPGAEEGSQTQYIWSHSWDLGSLKVKYDNVWISDYIIQPEIRTFTNNDIVGIGVFCHEFGHSLGLPDLYDTDGSSKGLGRWCLMSGGSWLNSEKTPAMMSAWCRETLGWVDPQTIPYPVTQSDTGSYSLQPAASSTEVIRILTQNPNEYFLLENKYKTGFNAYLPGSGLAIFHINTNQSDNNSENLKLVDLEEADGKNDLDNKANDGDTGDVFPGSSSNSVFNNNSNPSSKTYTIESTGIDISNIILSGSNVNFKLHLTSGNIASPNLTYNPSSNSLNVTGNTVGVNLQVINNGSANAGAFTVSYYLSATNPVTTSGYPMGTDYVSNLASGSNINLGNSIDISTISNLPPGIYYAGYIIDYTGAVTESDETDNTFTFTSQQINYNLKPNLTFLPEMNLLQYSNNTLNIGLEVTNNGLSASGSNSIGYYLSADQNITTSDYLLAQDIVNALDPEQTLQLNINTDIPVLLPSLPSGKYYVGYIIDYKNQVSESSESDNKYCFSNQQIDYSVGKRYYVFETICEGNYIVFDNDTLRIDGEYTYTFKDHLGSDSIVVLSLTVNPSDNIIWDTSICEGDGFQVGDSIFTKTGTYTVALENQYGCDSIVRVILTVRQPQITNLFRNICQGDSIAVGTSYFKTSGVFDVPLSDRYGCDSTVILHLTVNPVSQTVINETLCQGESVTIGGIVYNTAGTYIRKLSSVYGCDSTVTINIAVNTRKEVLLHRTICEGDSVFVGGKSFKTSGTFITTLTSFSGCDSVITLQLTVNPIYRLTIDSSICMGKSVEFVGIYYSTTGRYTHVLQSKTGCDSIVTLNLKVIPVADSIMTREICEGDSIVIANSVYRQTGHYQKILTNEGGCSYSINLNLVVHPSYELNIKKAICSGDSIKMGGKVFKASGDYILRLETAFGCDSVINLHIDVNPTVLTIVKDTICQGDSVRVGSKIYHSSGTYSNRFVNQYGCDSTVVLHLVVNPRHDTTLTVSLCQGESFSVGKQTFDQPGSFFINLENQFGCDSIIRLNLKILQPTDTTITTSICSGETYKIGSTTFDRSGNYSLTIRNKAGCDSIIHLNLTILPTSETNLEFSICEGDSVAIGQYVYKNQGAFSNVFVNQWGCDSIVRARINVIPSSNTVLNKIICEGETIQFGGKNIGTSGIYTNRLTNSLGCDSLVTLYLQVNPASHLNVTAEICEGDSYLFEGIRFTQSGQYMQTYLNQSDCDSIITLDLKVNKKIVNHLTREICDGDSVIIGNSVYKTQGKFTNNFVSAFGCDSVVMLALTVHPKYSISHEKTICMGDTAKVGNYGYTEEGYYTNILTSQFGCDSVVNLKLKVNRQSKTVLEETTCEGHAYFFNESYLTISGKYTFITDNSVGCDSIITLNLFVAPTSDTLIEASITKGDSIMIGNKAFTKQGLYTEKLTSQFGCDSVVTLKLTVSGEVPTGIEIPNNGDLVRFELYPNPSNGRTNLRIYNGGEDYRLNFINENGSVVLILKGKTIGGLSSEELNLEGLSKGMYSVILETNRKRSIKKLILQ